jgi:hypothetical protein
MPLFVYYVATGSRLIVLIRQDFVRVGFRGMKTASEISVSIRWNLLYLSESLLPAPKSGDCKRNNSNVVTCYLKDPGALATSKCTRI